MARVAPSLWLGATGVVVRGRVRRVQLGANGRQLRLSIHLNGWLRHARAKLFVEELAATVDEQVLPIGNIRLRRPDWRSRHGPRIFTFACHRRNVLALGWCFQG